MTFFWLSLFTACDEFGLDQQSWMNDTSFVWDSAGELAPLRVDSISPAAGPTSGGTAITIDGAGFDADTLVYFGGTELSVTFIDENTITLTSPSSAVETTVDVTISTLLGEIVVEDGYTYDNNADTTTDSGNGGGGGVSPTGLTAGLVEFWMQAYACPECFNLTQVEQVSASVTRHSPINASWLDWLPAVGTCTPNYTPPSLGVSGENIGDWVYLNTGSTSIPLTPQTQNGLLSYMASGLPHTDYVTNAQFDLSTSSGQWSLDSVLQTTTNFTDLQPANILTTSLQYAWSTPISASNATFTWAPYGTAADILVLMEVYHPSTKQYMGMILCRGTDSGAITVPASSFSTYYAQSPVTISIYRVLAQQMVDPTDGHTIEGLAVYGYIGTGRLVP